MGGSAWGTWKAGVSIVHSGIQYPEGVMKNIIPIVMAGVIGIYGLIVGVILAQAIDEPESNNRMNVYSTYTAVSHLCAGLCCGLSGLAAGGCIGIIGDYGIRCVGYRVAKVNMFEYTPPQQQQQDQSNAEERQRLLQEQPQNPNTQQEEYEKDDQNKLFVSMLIMLIFSEALALYGLIVALIVSQNEYTCETNESNIPELAIIS